MLVVLDDLRFRTTRKIVDVADFQRQEGNAGGGRVSLMVC